MRRAGFGRGSRVSTAEGEQGFWPSYADMMSAVALILFFLMLLSYIQNLITGNDLQNTQEALTETRASLLSTQDQLSLTKAQVDAAEKELSIVSSSLEEAKITLNSQEEEIKGYTAAISQYIRDMETYAKEIAGQEQTIQQQQQLIDWQEEYLAAANSELREMRSQMQTIAVLRLSILEQIRESIVEVMGDASKVTIGDNGSIILSEGVFFDLGSSDIKPESRPVLDQLIKVFTRFLSDSENAKYVDSVVISGHTDITGDAARNRTLSTDRANSVLNYLLSGDNKALDRYAQFFCAAGYGATRPVQSNDTVEGRAANRRIEISMILKDETVLEIVEQYLALEMPETASSHAPTPTPTPGARPRG
ncbi:MAG: OmpA family protein [Oscillospiraceae bacterium]|nr:OmpA family protein [Oscillospiraceae bacterium]